MMRLIPKLSLVVLFTTAIALLAATALYPTWFENDSRILDAARADDVERIAAILAEKPALIDGLPGGLTPLHSAAANCSLRAVRFLLERGADVDTRMEELGWTPLYWSASNGRVEMVRLLLQHGANPTIGDHHGETPYEVANRCGHGDVVELLRSR